MKKNLFLPIGVLTLAFPVLGAAQGAKPPPHPEPGLRYASAFSGYTPYEDPAPADWRALNDQVGQAALKSGPQAGAASGPAPGAKPAAPSPPAQPAGDSGHSGHGVQGGMK